MDVKGMSGVVRVVGGALGHRPGINSGGLGGSRRKGIRRGQLRGRRGWVRGQGDVREGKVCCAGEIPLGEMESRAVVRG